MKKLLVALGVAALSSGSMAQNVSKSILNQKDKKLITKYKPVFLILTAVLMTPTFADTFNPAAYKFIASYHSEGLYNLLGIGTWNGAPVGPGNMPSNDNRLLSSDISIYTDTNASTNIYVQVHNVTTTLGAYWFGTAFDNVTLTGVEIVPSGNPLPTLSNVTFSSNFANIGQVRAFNGNPELTEALTTTPGYTLVDSGESYLIRTEVGAYNGMTSLGNIYGTSRIRGGGVFQLSFAPTYDLASLDFSTIQINTRYGADNQYIGSTLNAYTPLNPTNNAVPEPSEWAAMGLLGTGLLGLVVRGRKKKLANESS